MEVIQITLIIYAALCLGFTVILTGGQNRKIDRYRGDDVTFVCYFPVNINFSNCQWYFTQNWGEERSLTNGTRYIWSCSPADSTWVRNTIAVKNVTFNDSGIYRCEAMTATGADRQEIVLTVVAKPEITVHKTNYTAVSDTNVTLECIVNANGEIITSIEWEYKLRTQWSRAWISKKYFWTIQMPSLDISNVQTWDSGFYRCLASTRVGTAEGPDILLNVQIADLPIVIVPQTLFFVTAGEDIVLNCSVNGSGVPIQDVIWYRRYPFSLRSLTNEMKYEWSRLGPDGSIRIKKVIENDRGIYVCEGTTVVGSSKGNDIELRVGYKPTVTVNEYNYSIGMGDNLTLHCSINGHGSTVKRVEWSKEINSQFRYLRPTTRVFWDISSPSIKINIVQLDDAGRYTCIGFTDFGTTTSSQISVQIFYLPVFHPPTEDLTGSPLEKYVVPGVSVFVCVALIALIVVVILIRRKRQKGRTDKPNLGIRSTNGQKHPSLSEKIRSGNNHAKFSVHLWGGIRKSSKNIDGNKSIRDTNIPQSITHIDGNNIIKDADASHVYMNINNAYAAFQQLSSTSNPSSYINEETESANTQMNKTEKLNYVELEFSSNALDENSSHGIRGVPSDTTYTEVVVFTR